MSKSKYEYTRFDLGHFPTTASKYRKINDDIAAASASGWKKDKAHIAMLQSVKADFEAKHSASELKISNEAQEQEYWVMRLAKEAAVQLLAVGKVDADTMFKMSCLDDESFKNCVRESTKLSSYLNHIVKEAERTVKPEDIVPEELMQ